MGFFKGVGKFFNDISGATSAAEQSYAYNKEFAQNAHQWEVADMEKAGLNPILSADGSGATGNVSPVSGGGQMATGLINTILDYKVMGKQNEIAQQDVDAKSALATAETKKKDAETFEQMMRNKYLPDYIKTELAERRARTELLGEQTNTQHALTEKTWEERNTAQWESQSKFWDMVKNSSDGEFMQKYGVTKDQAIEIFKSGGIIIGNIIKKPKPNTNKTSAKKGN